MTKENYFKIIKSSAWYDLIVTAAFATPWTFMFIYQGIQFLDSSLGLPGTTPDLGVMEILFANLLGTIVVVWAVLRLKHPLLMYGKYDAFGRIFFSIWQIYAVLSGASVILLVFTLFEVMFGVLQLLPVTKNTRKVTT